MTPLAVGAADIDAMLAVMADAFDPRFGEAWSAVQLGGSLAQIDTWARLVRETAADGRGAPLGFSLCRRIVDESELLLVAVVPAARRRGIGGALLETAQRDARLRGSRTMFLEMRDGNAAASQLYRAQGFVEIGRRRDYYRGIDGNRHDAVTMRRPLDD
ncbi:GNAT family N-acetyltransferase [Glacieibacterium frigidum]|uniref:GNAT family N-acetyltransferase n=1 Tax=Glacieibacterium frigidum TaxID=2593303 RepID=A0A552U9J8_9SPHN|nr:GNAT family N-acetyltransferase [Glacieibacterium frigidum]TRW14893.1 GNAT family N-acetyltransferase [Glacieibacterium frigidum]